MPACIFFKENTMNKKITALFLILLFNLIFAQFAGGTGTIEDPYQIGTPEQLNQVRYYLTSSFIQIADINLGVAPWNEGEGWDPIGDYDWSNPNLSFRGNYNGNGFKILNMYLNRTDESYLGLFGSTEGCLLKNLNVINFAITGGSAIGGLVAISYNDNVENCRAEGSIEGGSELGILMYFFEGYTIKNCHSKGEIRAQRGWIGGLISMCNADSVLDCSAETKLTIESNVAGGLFAQSIDTKIIRNCYSVSDIITKGELVGGFIGIYGIFLEEFSLIEKSFSKGSISSTSDQVGGFISATGVFEGCNSEFINLYANMDIIGNDIVAGFISNIKSNTDVENCYFAGQVTGNSNVSGFIGSIDSLNTVTVNNCYWDTETSGIDSSAAGEGRTTAEMTLPYSGNTYVGWDFSTVWRDDVINQNNGYPTFQWVSGIEENDDDDFVAGEKGFELYQNYPNPFNPVTEIKYALAIAGNVNIKVFNTNGSEVADLVNSTQRAGVYSVSFDASKYSNGIFYYTLVVDNKIVATKKMILIK